MESSRRRHQGTSRGEGAPRHRRHLSAGRDLDRVIVLVAKMDGGAEP